MGHFKELKQSILEALSAAEAEIEEVRLSGERALYAERERHRIEALEGTIRLAAERDEARRMVERMTKELVEAKARAERSETLAPPTTYGTATCRCGKVFHKVTRRQQVCPGCKSEQGLRLAHHLSKRRGEAESCRNS